MKSKAPAVHRPKLSFPEYLSAVNTNAGFEVPMRDMDYRASIWLESTQDEELRLFQAHRWWGKSRIVSAYVAWRLYRDPNFTCVVMSATTDRAIRNAGFIRKLIEKNALTEDLVDKKGGHWQRQTFTVKRDLVDINPSVTVTSLTSDAVGIHADLFIADDLETIKSTRNEAARKQLADVMDEFPNLTDHILYIGTPHGVPSIYTALNDNPACVSLRIPVYTTEPDGSRVYADPIRYGPDKVARLEKQLPKNKFESQYLLIPREPDGATLPIEFIHEYSDELAMGSTTNPFARRVEEFANIGDRSLIQWVAAYDPAQSKEGTDDAVLAVVGQDSAANIFIHRTIKLPAIDPVRGWDDQTNAVVQHCIDLKIPKLLIEDNTNKSMRAEVLKACERKRVRISIVSRHSTANKISRISEALEVPMAGGRIHAHTSVMAGPFKEQTRTFPQCCQGRAKNDYIDAVALGIGHLRKLPTAIGDHPELAGVGGGQRRSWIAVGSPKLGVHDGNRLRLGV